MTSGLFIKIPQRGAKYRLETDASKEAVAAVLEQQQETPEGLVWMPIGFISKKLANYELNWPIYNKELYAIVYGVSQF